MTKITIFSGFLGAGKTTLIKKLIQDGFNGEKLVLIENEFGQIGIDGGFLKEAGIQINEMNSGCICCSLVGDFGKALRQVLEEYHPDRILIEPSGVGKLSDVISAVQNLHMEDVELDGFTTVVDAKKCKMYQKNFGEFFNNQITYASCLILSHTAGLTESQLHDTVERLRQFNPAAPIVTTEWDELSGAQLIAAMTQKTRWMMNSKHFWRKKPHTIIITTTITMRMNTSITMITVRTAPAAAMTTITNTIITMQTKSSPAGASKHPDPIPQRQSPQRSKRSPMRNNSVWSCVQRVSSQAKTVSGFTLTMSPAHRMSEPAVRRQPADSVSSVPN